MNIKKIKIMGIAPYEGMEAIMRKLADTRSDFELETYIGDFKRGAEIVKEKHTGQYDVIISRGGTAEMIHSITNVPVIEVTLSVYDILRAMKLAENYAHQYAVVGFKGITTPARLLCDLLRYDMDIYTITNEEEVQSSLDNLKGQGYQMVLCDMITYTRAREMGLQAILITSGEESIAAAFDQAVNLCTSYAQSREQNRIFAETLQALPSFTVVMNADKSLLFSTCDTAEKEAIHDHLADMLAAISTEKPYKSFQTIGQSMYLISAHSIEAGSSRLTAFCLEPNPVPPLSSKYGLRYCSLPDIQKQLAGSFYNISNAAIHSMLHQLRENMHPVMLEGEEGTNKTETAYLLYTESIYNSNPLIIIDCALLNDKNWRFLTNHYSSPFCDNNNTIYISNLNALADDRRRQLLSIIIDMQLCKRNRLIFSWRNSYGVSSEPACREFINTLACLHLRLPSLREHTDEIASIGSLYLNTLNIGLSKQIIGFDPEALELLQGYHWPYNYIQLKRVLTELATLSVTPYINTDAVASILKKEAQQEYAVPLQNLMPVKVSDPTKAVIDLMKPLSDLTKQIVKEVLDACDGNQSKAARQLGISRTTLWRYIK